MTEEVMMIPTQEFERLQEFYKGQITQSALLNKAGRLAAEKHMILKNPKIPSATAIKMVKPMAREQARLTKRIRLGTTPTAGVGAPDEDEAMVDSPLEVLLKKIVKSTDPATPGPSGVKIEPSSIKKEKPSKASIPSTSGKKTTLSTKNKEFLMSIGVDPKYIDDDGGYTPKGKGKQPLKKAKKTELQKLQEGWEGWDEPTKKKLGYDTN